jgi:integrase
VPLTEPALAAIDLSPLGIDTPLPFFPRRRAGTSVSTRGEPAIGTPHSTPQATKRRGPYRLRHTFAAEALAAGISTFELARLMGTSIQMIDRNYGHLTHDSEATILARLNRSGAETASAAEAD